MTAVVGPSTVVIDAVFEEDALSTTEVVSSMKRDIEINDRVVFVVRVFFNSYFLLIHVKQPKVLLDMLLPLVEHVEAKLSAAVIENTDKKTSRKKKGDTESSVNTDNNETKSKSSKKKRKQMNDK